jgi:hypothetical protein
MMMNDSSQLRTTEAVAMDMMAGLRQIHRCFLELAKIEREKPKRKPLVEFSVGECLMMLVDGLDLTEESRNLYNSIKRDLTDKGVWDTIVKEET